tara:strand:+ start:12126 stop:13226 length:1101 start_codon:yes stop_codon:yes gene_type:complete
MKILSIVGTRPNFIKISPIIKELNKNNIENILVHTGQHYDDKMSKVFFDDLQISKPSINLGIGSGNYSEQIAGILLELEKVFDDIKPDITLVVGDVNSTLAATILSKQKGIPVAHIEAGLRSFDMNMPEEINRILVDRISDLLFTTEHSGNSNLLNEGIPKEKISFTGNVMIDTLLSHKEKSQTSNILDKYNLQKDKYILVTVHRPSNVDDIHNLQNITNIIRNLSSRIKIIIPLHPRTKKSLIDFKLIEEIKENNNIIITEPLGYLDFICMMSNSKLILTDSGGIQEESTILQIPCITLRDNTERPITVEQGTNLLVSKNFDQVISKVDKVLSNSLEINPKIPDLWDGQAAKRIVKILQEYHTNG